MMHLQPDLPPSIPSRIKDVKACSLSNRIANAPGFNNVFRIVHGLTLTEVDKLRAVRDSARPAHTYRGVPPWRHCLSSLSGGSESLSTLRVYWACHSTRRSPALLALSPYNHTPFRSSHDSRHLNWPSQNHSHAYTGISLAEVTLTNLD